MPFSFHFYHCRRNSMEPCNRTRRNAEPIMSSAKSYVYRLSRIINEVLFITREPLKPRSRLISNFSLHFDCETLVSRIDSVAHHHRCHHQHHQPPASLAIGMWRHNVLMFSIFMSFYFPCQFNEIGSCCSLPLTHHFLVCNMIDLIPDVFFFSIRLHNRYRTHS